MEQQLMNQVLHVSGMSCANCELRIEKMVGQLEGVKKVQAAFGSSTVHVTYDTNMIGLDKIIETIENEDYTVLNKSATIRVHPSDVSLGSMSDSKRGIAQENISLKNTGRRPQAKNQSQERISEDKMPITQLLGIGIILFALYLIIKSTVGFNFIPEVNQSMGYGVLFAVGLLTSLHCLAMCGGLNLSQCIAYKEGRAGGKAASLKPSLLYNGGRVISYTIVGGIVGALGSVVSFSGVAKGIIAMVAGIFMVIMGLNMLNVFPWLRKLNPRMPKFFGKKLYDNQGQYGPFYVGLLNGLMPCGPLQAMQLYALGTSSAVTGALSMLIFSLGTVPLMFGLGAISSLLSNKFTHKMLKVSGVLVMVLGFVMLSRGMALSGYNLPQASTPLSPEGLARVEGNTQYVTTTLTDGYYSPIVVQKGIPVKWTIKAQDADLNGCNNPVTIPRFDIEKTLVPGDNLIEFTPTEEGDIVYTCWMGMISSNIKVVADVSKVSVEDVQGASE